MTEKEVTPAQDNETTADQSKDGKSKVKKGKRHRTTDGQLNRVSKNPSQTIPHHLSRQIFNTSGDCSSFTTYDDRTGVSASNCSHS